ncbi:hypothetical protein KEJ27_03835 [Candidatus Bathyarchaeota archaeon]|nr:hypothetical protein [Candidatus Bathyarchaeota archaeon]MBS7612696.1 hypothetical protein [Candidatus Bathyarchaeota archaeon]MBS7618204.1 hypothetical protein [Candidatus Bathyarchaeota archaeon]
MSSRRTCLDCKWLRRTGIYLECWYGGKFRLVLPRYAREIALCETHLGLLELRYCKWEGRIVESRKNPGRI